MEPASKPAWNKRRARAETCEHSNQVRDFRLERLLSQDPERAQPLRTACVCSRSAEGTRVRCGPRARQAEPVRVTWHCGRSPGADPKGREAPTRRGKGRPGGGGAAGAPGIPCREAPAGDPVYNPPVTGPGSEPRFPAPQVRDLAGDLTSRGKDLAPGALRLF